MTPAEQLAEIRARTLPMLQQQRRYFHDEIMPALDAGRHPHPALRAS